MNNSNSRGNFGIGNVNRHKKKFLIVAAAAIVAFLFFPAPLGEAVQVSLTKLNDIVAGDGDTSDVQVDLIVNDPALMGKVFPNGQTKDHIPDVKAEFVIKNSGGTVVATGTYNIITGAAISSTSAIVSVTPTFINGGSGYATGGSNNYFYGYGYALYGSLNGYYTIGNGLYTYGVSGPAHIRYTLDLNAAAIGTGTFTIESNIKNEVSGQSDNYFISTPISFSSTAAANNDPTADAGDDQTVVEGATVTLDGSGSSDPDAGDSLTFSWTQTAGTSVTLTGATTANPTFTAPSVTSATTLTFQLEVEDESGATDTDTVSVTVEDSSTNTAPVADAGDDQTVQDTDTVTLDGSGSSDADGNTLTFAWVQTGGTTVTLSDDTAQQPTFAAPNVSTTTVLTFELTVSDGVLTDTDTVNIIVENFVEEPPVANAGKDRTVSSSTATQTVEVQLDGSGSSDPNGDDLTFAWTQLTGPAVTLSDATDIQPTFDSPLNTALTSTITSARFQLIVTDENGNASVPDIVEIKIKKVTTLKAPSANAGKDKTVTEGDIVNLTGTGSDPDGSEVTFAWAQTSPATPVLTIDNDDTATPSFAAPDVSTKTVFTLTLTVTDGQGQTKTDTVKITVNNFVNKKPKANAGPNQTVDFGATVTLDGSKSSDGNGDVLSFTWTQTAGTAVTLSNANVANPTFTAPSSATTLKFSLVVNDGRGLSDSASTADTVDIKVKDIVSAPPKANAGKDKTVNEGDLVQLAGSGTDPNGTPITAFAWTQTAGTSVTLVTSDIANPVFVAPEVPFAGETLTFSLTVTSGGQTSTADTVKIKVKNTLDVETGTFTITQNGDAGTSDVTVTIDAIYTYTEGKTANAGKVTVTPINGTLTVDLATGTDISESLDITKLTVASNKKSISYTAKYADGTTGSVTGKLSFVDAVDFDTPTDETAQTNKDIINAKVGSTTFKTTKASTTGDIDFA